ncbi:16S rRNA (uracil(1498)-N(3))-methyltransferase [Desulfurobacterium atlanticum]|uniref:Ribosomal RNA small subunit methyltransferase E n=1 Tax=Desulfurobacterium atlanticum TaxID=240169 RepID=A0A238XL22_9BACT|nr:16S rRNA (uracil(1498)-N(3))-methyltransferase [Desulfurobacterium atlanticum]SNR58679.1 16S rRNA (uracil1498-N3)-methyltransferase [Desulfurobacterium atlanticum]
MRRFKVNDIREDVAYLRGQEARHVLKVLRLRPGDEIVIFDGKGNEYLAVIEASSTQSVRLKVLEKLMIDRESPLKTVLYMGLTNRLQKFEMALQKATELGVSRIVPIICKRSAFGEKVKDWSGKLRRWNEIVVNASKQCGRAVIPPVEEPVKLLNIDDDSELKFVLWERGGKSFNNFKDNTATSVSLLVGPEGGLDESEVEILKSKGFHVIHLGKRIMRAETAAIVGLAIVQYIWGDLK